MPPRSSQPTRASSRETRPPEWFRSASQPVRRRASPPPSPRREERLLEELEPRRGVEEAEGQAPPPVRIEVIGVGEEEEILELDELQHGGGEEEEGAGGEGAEEIGPEAAVRGEALLQPVGRRLRGAEAEQGDVASRLDPEIPGPRNGAPLVDADGWREIDRLGAWECAMNMFASMEDCY